MPTYIWRANPKYWASEADLERYIRDPSRYVYWSTPQHTKAIRVGDHAFIYLSSGQARGVVAVGVVEELPRLLPKSGSSAQFRYSIRLPAAGWSEDGAPSRWKTGIRIVSEHWANPLPSPRPRGHQTVERLKDDKTIADEHGRLRRPDRKAPTFTRHVLGMPTGGEEFDRLESRLRDTE